jgi:hypothetical protein
MRKIFLCTFIIYSACCVFTGAHRAFAWTDDVEGVLMPEARGGGGISGEEAEESMQKENSSSSDPQALIEIE